MDCSEARTLISAGTQPGAGPGQSPELGFHLSGCPACRAFRRIDLFDREQARRARVPAIPPRITAPVSAPVPRARAGRALLRIGAGLALIMCTWLAWYVGLPLLRAWHDLGTITSLPPMREVAASAAEPEMVVATGTPAPAASATQRPSRATVTPSLLPATPGATATPRLAAGAAHPFAPEPSNIPTPTSTSVPTATPPPTDVPPSPTAIPPSPTAAPPPPTATARPEPLSQAVAPAGSAGGVTILLLGIDARPGEATGRSDALLVVHVDPERQTAAILSLPRDLWVAIPGIGEGKINGAYLQGGARTAAATVGQALGVSIDQSVVVDFAGFRSLIDALGGVTVNVSRELYDAKFPTIDYGYTIAHFLPGPQLMDGSQALMYSRIRHPDSDFQRMRRQQAVLLGISAQLRKIGTFQSLHEADRITGALTPYVRTSMERGATVQLLWSLRNINLANVRQLVLDGGMVGETSIGGSYALVADPATLQSLGAQLIAP